MTSVSIRIDTPFGITSRYSTPCEPPISYRQCCLFQPLPSQICPGFPEDPTIEAVRTAKGALARVARSRKIAFSTIGIASDLVAADGLSHLRQIGMWDEISAGRRGRNSGMERYVYGDMPGASGTPQVLVVLRSVGESIWAIPTERVLLRQVGLFAIEEWVAAGLPVPTGHLEK